MQITCCTTFGTPFVDDLVCLHYRLVEARSPKSCVSLVVHVPVQVENTINENVPPSDKPDDLSVYEQNGPW